MRLGNGRELSVSEFYSHGYAGCAIVQSMLAVCGRSRIVLRRSGTVHCLRPSLLLCFVHWVTVPSLPDALGHISVLRSGIPGDSHGTCVVPAAVLGLHG